MPNNDDTQSLDNLTSQVTRSLRSLLGRSALMATVPLASLSTITSRPRNSGLNSTNGLAFLDDEREIRVLAKEIKRLIAEDTRRGLKV